VIGHILYQSGIPFVILERLDCADLRAFTKAGSIEHCVVEALKPFCLTDPILTSAPAAASRNFGWTSAFILN